MVSKLIIGVVLAVALSAAAVNAQAAPLGGGDETGGETLHFAPGGQVGLFCEVEKVDVCVITQTEGDCTKLGGEKVDSCSMAEKIEDKK